MNNKIRQLFPFFNHQKNLIYLDSAGTNLKPNIVIQAINNYYKKYSINSHSESNNPLFSEVQKIVQQTREIIAQRIKAKSEEIFFLPSATYSLNLLTLSLKNFLKKDDLIFLTHLEHSSNCYPWQSIAQEKKAQVDFLPLDDNFIIDVNILDKYIDKKVKIVSFFHLSNSLGVINPVKEITQKIKKINPNCLVIVDACQSIARLPINVQEWDIDALVFSGHKIYGPTGIGVLWIRKELAKKLPDILWGGGKKNAPNQKIDSDLLLAQKFEVGTLPLAQIFGLQKSFEFLNSLDIQETSGYEKKLKNYALQELGKLKKVIIYNKNLASVGIILFNLESFHAHDVADYLGRNNICVRAGNFCCPYLKEVIGVESAIRISFSIYNTKKDINKLIFFLKELIKSPNLLLFF
ncbi:MAG: aminotransferase class V-fold PLP-dependent enzyme [Candidatus Moeniiplasma glomeromycotorum]|nr:aminotransferase class V-fold PLP-dependent enzyme [Candidatus Moeniiplasma glomeromycotorum]